MKGDLNSNKILIVCCEGATSYLTEEEYFKQLHSFIRANKPEFINFTDIQLVKIKLNKLFNRCSLIKKLQATNNHKPKFSFVAIWKDNDKQTTIQNENKRLCKIQNQLFECLRQTLKEEKQEKENFDLWILPQGWNFETYYRHHFSEPLDISDRELKEKFRSEYNHFINKLFKEENFRNIDSKLKQLKSNIELFDFED